MRNYHLRQLQPYSWKGDLDAWQEIFSAVGVEVSSLKFVDKKEAMPRDSKISIVASIVKTTGESSLDKTYQ